MTLEEVAYIINGRVRVRSISEDDENPTFEATLLDRIGDPVSVEIPSTRTRRRFETKEAKAVGSTPEKARESLAWLLKGRAISYAIPVMWTSVNPSLQLPPTLVAGSVGPIPRLKPIPEDGIVAASGKFRATTIEDSIAYQVGEDVGSAEEAMKLCQVIARDRSQPFEIFDDQGESRYRINC